MCYIRVVAGDYDDWAAQGADGWDWASVLPCFMRAEGNARGASDLHGGDGPLTVPDLRNVNPLSRVFIEAGQQAGPPRHEDRQSAVSGKSVTVRVDRGGRRIIKKQKK